MTEVETWLRDPYGLYAKHILRLRALRPIEESADAADYGQVVHAAIAAFLGEIGGRFPPDADARLLHAMDAALERQPLRPALAAWWRPRLHRIAGWLAGAERDRRLGAGLAELASEREGTWSLDTAAGFTLTGRADRIERRFDGGIAILDYKTGSVPDARDVLAGLAPQLPLEAAMAMDGAFGEEMRGRPVELVYWHLSGGYVPGEVRPALKDSTGLEDVVATARDKLCALVHTYDDPAQPYLSRPHPGQAPRFSDYTQLARVAEWSAAEEGE